MAEYPGDMWRDMWQGSPHPPLGPNQGFQAHHSRQLILPLEELNWAQGSFHPPGQQGHPNPWNQENQ